MIDDRHTQLTSGLIENIHDLLNLSSDPLLSLIRNHDFVVALVGQHHVLVSSIQRFFEKVVQARMDGLMKTD